MKLKEIFTPKLFSGLAVAGVVVTAIVAAVEAIGAEDTISNAKASIPEGSTKLEISKHVIPRVVPSFKKTIVIGCVTVGCIIASSYLSGVQIAALTGSLAAAVSQRDAIEKEIVKLPGGEEALKKVKKEMALNKVLAEKEKKKKEPWRIQTIEETGYGSVLVYDEWSGRLFRSDPSEIEKQQEEFNTERDEGEELPFSDNEDINLPTANPYNDLLIKYGIEPCALGHQFGYPSNDDLYEHRRIPFKNYWLRLSDMDVTQQRRYGEDLFVISMPSGYYPMECWQEV